MDNSLSSYITIIEKLLHKKVAPRFTVIDFISEPELLDFYNNKVAPENVVKYIWRGTARRANLQYISDKLRSISKEANYKDFNSSLTREKFKSEIVRILYYMYCGYNSTPHPWGLKNRPQFPERLPLPIIDKEVGKDVRKALENLINSSKWDSWIRQLLKAAKGIKK
jgi:hypothetical protein